jgi:hypothetical protein
MHIASQFGIYVGYLNIYIYRYIASQFGIYVGYLIGQRSKAGLRLLLHFNTGYGCQNRRRRRQLVKMYDNVIKILVCSPTYIDTYVRPACSLPGQLGSRLMFESCSDTILAESSIILSDNFLGFLQAL